MFKKFFNYVHKFSKSSLIAVCSLTIVLSSNSSLQVAAASQNTNASSDLTKSLDSIVSDFTKAGKFSGTVLAVQNGKKVFEKGYGFADYDYDILNTEKTKYQIGSISKEFTAAAIFKLQEQKKLSIYDKLNKYIKDYPKGDKITLVNLLNHTSGIPDYISFKELYGTEKEPYSVEKLINTFKNRKLNFEPGTNFKYSSSEFILLGYVIEKVSGKSYKQFMTDNFFVPLGLKDTGYDDYDTIVKSRSLGYGLASDGKTRKRIYLDISLGYAAGGLYSTVEDLYKWNNYFVKLKNLYNNDESKMLVKPYAATSESPTKKSCCGYFIDYFKIGNQKLKYVYHPGHINGYMANDLIFPDYDTQLIILSNFDNADVGRLSLQLSIALLANDLSKSSNNNSSTNQENKTSDNKNISLKNMDVFVGDYLINAVGINAKITKKNEGLFVDVGALGNGNLAFKGQDGNNFTFKNDEKNIVINFTLENNEVKDVKVTAFGQTLKATKVVEK